MFEIFIVKRLKMWIYIIKKLLYFYNWTTKKKKNNSKVGKGLEYTLLQR